MSAVRLVLFVALRQLWARKFLNGIAVAGVALGVLTLVTLNAIMQGFQVRFKEEIVKVSPHVVVSARKLAIERSILATFAGRDVTAEIAGARPGDKVGSILRPRELSRLFEAMPEVEAVCSNLRGQAIAMLGTQTQGIDLRGVRPEEQDRCTPVSNYVVEGTWGALSARRDGLILGSGVAAKLGARVGDRVRVASPEGRTEALAVVGVMDVGIPAIDGVRAYVNLTTAQSLFARPSAIGHLEVRLHRPFDSTEFARRAEVLTGYESEGWQETNANFLRLFDLQNLIVRLVIFAVLTLGGFGIFSTQIMIVMQRTKDFAILRSVGFRRSDILLGVVVQGVIVALLGGALGNLAGWRTVEFLGGLEINSEGILKSTNFIVHKAPVFYVYGACFALLVGVVSSLVPAVRAARVQPVAVLRGLVG